MDMEKVKAAKSREEVRQYAIEWQKWISTLNLSYEELHEWQRVFEFLAFKFCLVNEFQENCII